MNSIKIYASSIFSFILGVFFVNYFDGCKDDKKNIIVDKNKYEIVSQVIDTQYITKDTIVYRKSKDIVRDTAIYVDVSWPVDTAQILKDFYSISVFSDTLDLDRGYVLITDSVSQNKILSRKYIASVSSGYISEKIYLKEKAKTSFFWGVGAGVGKSVNEASVNIFMQTPSKKLYGVGVGVINGTPVVKGNLLIKL